MNKRTGENMFRNKIIYFIFGAFLLYHSSLQAQTAPVHTRVLFSDDLTSGGTKAIGEITNIEGTFTENGWQTLKKTSQLVIALKEYAPFEGTIEFKIKGFNPDNINFADFDWAPIFITSRGIPRITEMDDTPGSYIYIKSDQGLNDGTRTGFILWSSPFNGDLATLRTTKTYPVAKLLWSADIQYTFRFTWGRPQGQSEDLVYMWLRVTDQNGQVVPQGAKVHVFDAYNKQKHLVESFSHIYLGKDGVYPGLRGVTFSDLRILGPATEVPFTNVALSRGLAAEAEGSAQGISIADIDNDAAEDIYIARFFNTMPSQANQLFVQQNDGTFANEAAARGTADSDNTYSCVIADFDGDGDQDIFYGNSDSPNTLLFNDGTGKYTDVSSSNGILNEKRYTNGVTVIDLENDGDFDIVAANAFAEHEVYVNDGSGHFSDLSRGLRGYTGASATPYGGIIAGDVNNDGFQDLILTRYNSPCPLFINDGTGNFTEQASTRGFNVNTTVSTATLGDIDNDGDLDIFVCIQASAGDPAPLLTFRNDGSGNFANITDEVGLDLNTHGVLLGDWDNDGDLDIFAGRRNEKLSEVLLNDGTGNFTLRLTGAEIIRKDARGAAAFDYDDDGDLDIFAASRGGELVLEGLADQPYGRNYMLRNDLGNGNHYLKVAVYNDEGAPAGAGAKISIYQAGHLNESAYLIGYREIVPISDYYSQSSWIQHFGLGSNNQVDIKINLPNGKQQNYRTYAADQLLEVYPSQVIPDHILVTGCNQQGKAGQDLPNPVTVQVLDEESFPVTGYPINFEITSGSGTLNGDVETTLSIPTDVDGYASVNWRMGQIAGLDNRLVVSCEYNGQDLAGSPLTCSILPGAGDPAVLHKVEGDGQTGLISQQLDTSLTVRVTDRYDNNVADFPVQFTISEGSGILFDGVSGNTLTKNTDNMGTARVRWQLGPLTGQQKVRVTSSFNDNDLQNSPMEFTAIARTPDLFLIYQSGADQSGLVNSTLPLPFVVKVEDTFGIAAGGKTIQFIVIAGGGNFSGKDTLAVMTNTAGLASATATLGTEAGTSNNIFHARVVSGAANSPYEFKASARPGPVTKITDAGGSGQTGTVHQRLAEPFVVRLLDSYDNPIGDKSVNYDVTAGNGTINGSSSAQVTTNSQGFASAYLRLGTTLETNTVSVSTDELPGQAVLFSAEALVGHAARLTMVSGNGQKGSWDTTLGQQLAVAVHDSFFNPIENHEVVFSVTQGGGNILGQISVSRITNVFGQVSVPFTLGPTDFYHEVEARSTYNGIALIGSPQIFTATTGPGDADSLYHVSGNGQKGAINQPLLEPFVVKVVDENGIPIGNHEVEFITFSQGAHFDGKNRYTIVTSDDGIASATATLGSEVGDNNYIFQAIAKLNDVHLKGSPFELSASGRITNAVLMEYVSGDSLSGAVGTSLTEPFKVRVRDRFDRPVSNHPVDFQITQGDSLLDARSVNITIKTDDDGIAQVTLLFGGTPGVTTVRASSTDGMSQLSGSPIDFQATSLPGSPDANKSIITASTPVIANGQTASIVLITLKDRYGNALADKAVEIFVAGLDVVINQPSQVTDAYGQTQGTITTVNTGKVTVWARADGQDISATTVEFIPGPPAVATPYNTDQIQEINKILPKPIGVVVKDGWNHVTKNISVTFSVKDGGGTIIESQPVRTDENGRAEAHWHLGPVANRQHALATVAGIATPVEFTAFAIPPTPESIEIVSGNQQIGFVDQPLGEPLVVSVKDSNGTAIPNITISFELIKGTGNGQGTFTTPNPTTTDQLGFASVSFSAGTLTGEHLIRASLASFGKSVDFDLFIESEPTLYLEKTYGDGQSIRPATALQIGVRAKDAFNRPQVGKKIKFEVVRDADGYLTTPQPVTTGAEGQAAVTWVVGTSGPQELKVSPVEMGGEPVTFTALVMNARPVIQSPIDYNPTIQSGNSVQFTVTATDPDDDPISYGVRQLPQFATFDSTGSHQFLWTPKVDQIGTHSVIFVASDPYGATDSSTVVIKVEKAPNRCPDVISYQPTELIMIVEYNSFMTFRVTVDDPDNDSLMYDWVADDGTNISWLGDQPTLPIQFNQVAFPEPDLVIQVTISDGICNQPMSWQIRLIPPTIVELESFEAEGDKNRVELNWKTSKELNNYGFYILKSTRREGDFAQINSAIITPQPGGSYSFIDKEVKSGQTYFYKLQDVDINGRQTEHGPVSVELALPEKVMLAQNYPNPFNPVTTIYFELPEMEFTSLTIYNITGQVVRRLVDSTVEAGVHEVIWDGTNENGVLSTSGIYYYQLRVKDEVFTKKLLLLK